MKTIKSKRFGVWELRKNGIEQHGLKFKEFVNKIMNMGKHKGITKKQAIEYVNDMKDAECWYSKCDKYKVVKKKLYYQKDNPNNLVHDKSFDGSYHLSIRINMGKDYLCDWRDFQEIKNDLVGKEYCAVEIYPPETRVHDTDNVFHLWVFPKGLDIPIGWLKRDTTYHESPFQRGKEH
jgi:hypothetical protein